MKKTAEQKDFYMEYDPAEAKFEVRRIYQRWENGNEKAAEVIALTFEEGWAIAMVNALNNEASQLPVEGERDDRIIKFLLGECDYDGKWFGELHDDRKGAFWWRTYLRKYLEAPDNNVK